MIGDKIIVKEKHRQAADKLFSVLNAIYNEGDKKLTIGIGGESGSGKSELAVALKELFLGNGISCVILQQDDYFNFPPKTNAEMRRENIELVGPGEVNLGLLDHHLIQFKNRTDSILKPLVRYEENQFTDQVLPVRDINVLIAEGTYVCKLDSVDYRIFIDRTYTETKKDRLLRNREEQDEFLENVLIIEHNIIKNHKSNADAIVTKGFEVIF